MKSIELYNNLIEKINSYEAKLLSEYSGEIACRNGCSECCILQSVFPVEAFYIYSLLKKNRKDFSIPGAAPAGDTCVFLDNNSCSIYSCRPVICRTHGYPLMESGRVDFCPRNFTRVQSIDSGFILDLDALNRALVSVNMIFLRENNDDFFNAERIYLRDIIARYR